MDYSDYCDTHDCDLCQKIDWWDDVLFVDRYQCMIFNFELIIWVIGILGNLASIVVFRHKNMARKPINLIFWWLSISDLLELAVVALQQWNSNWDGMIEIIQYDMTVYTSTSQIVEHLIYLVCIYLIQVFHTITIGLNIVLVFCQYIVVAYPLMNQKNLFNNRFIKLVVICMYSLSFVLYLPTWYIYEIHQEGENYWMYRVRYIEDPIAYMCILFCGIVLRIGPLIILIILCVLLLFAMRNTNRHRQSLGMPAYQLTKAQRKVNRINVTIVMIIFMFFITEVPFGIINFSVLSDNEICNRTISRVFILPSTLLNCSYSVFCYLIRIKEYRKTLKLLLSKSDLVSSTNPVTELTDLELHSL